MYKIIIIIILLFASGKWSEPIDEKVDEELGRLDKHQNLLRYSKSNRQQQSEMYKDLRSKLEIPLKKLLVVREKIEGVIHDKTQLLNNYGIHFIDLKKLQNGTDHTDVINNMMSIGKLILEKNKLQKLLMADEKDIQKDIAAIYQDYQRKTNEFQSIINEWVGEAENVA